MSLWKYSTVAIFALLCSANAFVGPSSTSKTRIAFGNGLKSSERNNDEPFSAGAAAFGTMVGLAFGADVAMAAAPSLAAPPQQQQQQQVAASVSSSSMALSSPSRMNEDAKAWSSSTLTTAADAAAPARSNDAAGSGIQITAISYDGAVPTTEADEYVVITNKSKPDVDVSKYCIYVATTGTQGPTFYFPNKSVLKPNQSVRVYTNEVHKETGGYSFGSGKALWNNRGGLAVLKDASGKKLMEFKYKPVAAQA